MWPSPLLPFLKLNFMPTIFSQPTTFKSDIALLAWGEGKGGCLQLHNKCLGIPIIIFVSKLGSHSTSTLVLSGYAPTVNSRTLHIQTALQHAMGNFTLLFQIIPAATGACCQTKNRALSYAWRLCQPPTQSSYSTMACLPSRRTEHSNDEGKTTRPSEQPRSTIRRIYNTSGSNWCPLNKLIGPCLITKS